LKIFDVIATALKPGGKHFMDVNNAEHAERYFPKTNWEIGEKSLALAQFDWDAETRRMTYAGYDIPYGKVAQKPQINMEDADPIRLYSLSELEQIIEQRNMHSSPLFPHITESPRQIERHSLWFIRLSNSVDAM
jgi:hypothetical protein